MSLLNRLIGAGLRLYAERGARGKSLDGLAAELETSAGTVTARMAAAADTPANREAANHVLGIEGWGQKRLRVALGEPLVLDSYRPYRLPEGTPIAELAAAFAERRRTTVALVRELEAAGVDPTGTVRHNAMGELSVAGWLTYLEQHASRESRYRLRASQRSSGGPRAV
jgi:hypothetical protein